MCATEPRAGKEPAYAELLDEDLTDTRPASSDDSVDGPSKGVQFSADVQSAGEQRQPIVEATGGSMTAVIVLVLNVTYAGVVFHGPFLGHFMSYGIALNLLSTALSTAWLSNARKQLPYVCVADSFMAVLFAQGGSRILDQLDSSAAFSTLILAMTLTSVFLGVAYILMGCAKVCKVVQFVPSPVMAGYQASIGYLLLDSAASLCSGCSIVDLLNPRARCRAKRGSLERDSSSQLALAFTMGVALYLMQQRSTRVVRTMWIPSMLLLSTLFFQLARLTHPAVATSDWTLDVPESTAFFDFSSVISLDGVDWGLAFQEALLTSVTALVPNVIGKLLQYSALEQKFDVDVDYNAEITHNGFSQLAAAPGVMTPTVTYLGMVVAHDLGARSNIAQVMVIGTSSVLFLTGSSIVSYVPKSMFAAILVSSGCSMLVDNFKQAWTNFPKREFALVIVHVALTAALGMLYAVVLGLLFTAVIFIIQYSRHSGVLQHATLLLERSKVARTPAEQEVLEEFGATTLVVHLHGMIFFGSANSVVDEVRSHLATLEELNLPLRFLLLDFDRCSAIDSSAVAVLLQMRRVIKSARLICACAGTDVLDMLLKGAAKPGDFEHFTTLDLALEHCENRLFDFYAYRRDVSPSLSSPVVRHSMGLLGSQARKELWKDADDDARLTDNWPPPQPSLEAGGWTARNREMVPSDGYSSGDNAHHGTPGSSYPASDDGSYGGEIRAGVSNPGADRGLGVVVYTPEEARAQLDEEALQRLRARFIEAMVESYGARELEDLVHFMDVILVPPHTVISTYPNEETGEENYLYVLDRGYVSAFATLDERHLRGSQQPSTSAGDNSGDGDPGASRHRLAKYGPGTILGVSSFVMPREMPGLTIMPMVTVADTFCQMLRLPRSRCDLLEASQPALMFRLYRLLVIISERRLQDHRLRVVASEAFKINVIPSTDFQRMLVADPSDHGERTDPALDPSTADSDAQHGAVAHAPAPAGPPDMLAGVLQFAMHDVSDGEDGPSAAAPAVSPPSSRRPEALIPMSNSRDRQLIPSSNSRDRDLGLGGANASFDRPGHEPQVQGDLSNFQAALIADKIRDKDADREGDDKDVEPPQETRKWWANPLGFSS